MKKLLVYTILVLLFVNCKKREYVNVDEYSIFKNYSKPDTVPFDISKLTKLIDSSLIRPNKIMQLNAFNIIHGGKNKIYKIDHSFYKFLHKRFLECSSECLLNTSGFDENIKENYEKINEQGCYYYCGNLKLTPNIQSMVFLSTIYENYFNKCDLILFNIKEKKLRSVIKLSRYNSEEKEEDIMLKTYLVNNDYFISIVAPEESYQEVVKWGFTKKNDKLTFEKIGTNKVLTPYYYYKFYLEPEGFIILSPTTNKIKNIELLNSEGRIPNKRFDILM